MSNQLASAANTNPGNTAGISLTTQNGTQGSRGHYGDIGIPVGTWFKDRESCRTSGMHPHNENGICGKVKTGAYSICISGEYEDNVDAGDIIFYTGTGGRSGQRGPQTHAQSFDDQSNRILSRSVQTRVPVRVIRGSGGDPRYSPADGFRYDGLYTVTDARYQIGRSGYLICVYMLMRLEGQDPIETADDG